MQASERCIAAIKRAAGFRSSASQDAAGVWSVGYGWTAGAGPETVVTENAADIELRYRVGQTARAIAAELAGPLTQARFDALVKRRLTEQQV